MLSGKLQNLRGLLEQIYCSAMYSEEAAQYSGAQQETVESPAIAWRYQEILSAKQAVVGFRRKPDT